MADSSKIPLRNAARDPRVDSLFAPSDRPLRLILWPAIGALIGLAGAAQSAVLLGYILNAKPPALQVALIVVSVIALNVGAVVVIVALSQRDSILRMLLAFIFSFLAHISWFSFAVGLKQDVVWSFVPGTYLAALACSIAIDPLRRIARSRRTGAVAATIPPEVMRRLDPGVELVLDPSADLSQYDVLLVDLSATPSPDWARFISSAALSGCEIRHVRSYILERTSYLMPEDINPDMIVHRLQRNCSYGSFKRCIDIGVVILMAPIALTLGGLAALAIMGTMGGPVIFTQERVGRNGRVFRMHKLRTMTVHGSSGRQTATSEGDCRITPLGKVLRRYRIDELPQLYNVLKGDMSLIGPRPEQPQLVEEYRQLIPHYDLRHAVQPGLSGWAQVSFGYASTVEETRTKLTYDLFYVKEFGLALDVEIAVATVWTLLAGRNAR